MLKEDTTSSLVEFANILNFFTPGHGYDIMPTISNYALNDLTNSKIYNLNNKEDFNTLIKGTDMGYYKTDPNTKVFFANGMDNNLKDGQKSVANLEDILNQPVGLILNDTHGIANDTKEYLDSSYKLKDVLNEYTYRKINNQAKDKILIITHSAGNEDINKAISLGAKQGYSYPNLNVISVGSPLAKRKLENTLNSASANLIGQVNDWKDPVTHSKTVGIGIIGLGALGVYFAPTIPVIGLVGNTAIVKFAAGAAAGAAGTISGAILFHPFKKYLKKPELNEILKNSVFYQTKE